MGKGSNVEFAGNGDATVLIIEDDPMNTMLLQEICESSGWKVHVAYDGRQGLSLARGLRPDVIVLDLMMPRVDGFGVLMVLQSDPQTRRIPVVVVTAVGGDDARDRAMELGAFDYMRKPFGVAELVSHVEVALGRSTSRKRRKASMGRPRRIDTPFDGDAAVMEYLARPSPPRTDEREAEDTVGMMLMGGAAGREVDTAKMDALMEALLKVVKRPHRLYRLKDGSVAVVVDGADVEYLAHSTQLIHTALRTEFEKNEPAFGIYFGCVSVNDRTTESSRRALAALQGALDEARRTGQQVFVVE